jgi:ketosteroid isomerase-like protein
VNTRSIIWGFLFAGVMALSGAAAWADTGADEQAVIAGEHQFDKALSTNNVDLVASLVADNYVSTNIDGAVFVGKAANIADMKEGTLTSYESTDLKVTVYRDTAIATAIFSSKGTYKGTPADALGRYTDTWVKMNGKWLCVASHSSRIKK